MLSNLVSIHTDKNSSVSLYGLNTVYLIELSLEHVTASQEVHFYKIPLILNAILLDPFTFVTQHDDR